MNTVKDGFSGNRNEGFVLSGKTGITPTGQYHACTIVFHFYPDLMRLFLAKQTGGFAPGCKFNFENANVLLPLSAMRRRTDSSFPLGGWSLTFEKPNACKIMTMYYTIEKLRRKIKAISKDVTISVEIKCHIHLDLGYADDVKMSVH
jgi:hypothetical protein